MNHSRVPNHLSLHSISKGSDKRASVADGPSSTTLNLDSDKFAPMTDKPADTWALLAKISGMATGKPAVTTQLAVGGGELGRRNGVG